MSLTVLWVFHPESKRVFSMFKVVEAGLTLSLVKGLESFAKFLAFALSFLSVSLLITAVQILHPPL